MKGDDPREAEIGSGNGVAGAKQEMVGDGE